MQTTRIVWILMVLCGFALQPALAAEKVLIVYPLQTNIDPALATQANSAFAQGLLKTGAYLVISGQDLGLLLEAQGSLLSGIFDETKVLSIGRMLPAELMASGEIRAAGSDYFIQLKIHDLATGTVLGIEAETVKKSDDIEKTIRKLVLRLTGKSGAPETGAAGYFSLTVTADRKEAVVYLDGKEYGTTPLLMDNVPAGTYFLEIKKESLYYSEQITVDQNRTIYGSLQQRFGSLIIRTTPGDAAVTVGSINYGKSQFIDQIPAWNQAVILQKPGYYWQGVVPIIPGKTVKIDITLNPTATVIVHAADDVFSQFYGNNLLYEFQGNWEIKDLPPGSYVLESGKAGYRQYRKTVEIRTDEKIELTPEMVLTAEVQAARQELSAELASITLELKNIALPEIYLENPVPDLDLISIKNTFFALIPMLDIFILFDKPLLPHLEKTQYEAISATQFAAGLLFQLSLAALVFFDDDAIRITSAITAVAAGGTNIGLGIYAGAEAGSWTRRNKDLKNKYAAMQKRVMEIQQLLPAEGK